MDEPNEDSNPFKTVGIILRDIIQAAKGKKAQKTNLIGHSNIRGGTPLPIRVYKMESSKIQGLRSEEAVITHTPAVLFNAPQSFTTLDVAAESNFFENIAELLAKREMKIEHGHFNVGMPDEDGNTEMEFSEDALQKLESLITSVS